MLITTALFYDWSPIDDFYPCSGYPHIFNDSYVLVMVVLRECRRPARKLVSVYRDELIT